jgi:hypothetical protein
MSVQLLVYFRFVHLIISVVSAVPTPWTDQVTISEKWLTKKSNSNAN